MIHYICLFVFLFEVSLLLRRELEAPALFFVPPFSILKIKNQIAKCKIRIGCFFNTKL